MKRVYRDFFIGEESRERLEFYEEWIGGFEMWCDMGGGGGGFGGMGGFGGFSCVFFIGFGFGGEWGDLCGSGGLLKGGGGVCEMRGL